MKRITKSALLQALLNPLRQVLNNEYHFGNPKDIQENLLGNRRKFLNETTKILAASSVLSPILNSNESFGFDESNNESLLKKSTKTSNQPRITIIGAGIAGLNTAYQLKKKGINVYIYEASQRVGGRIYTTKNIIGEGLYSELGGEFIDSNHSDIIDLAKELKLELMDTQIKQNKNSNKQTFFIDGVHYTEHQVIEAFQPFATQIKNDQQSLSTIITADAHSETDKLFDNLSISQYFDRIGLKGWLRKLLDVAYFTEFGMPINEQTALNFLLLITPTSPSSNSIDVFGESDERYKVKGGNQLITDKLAKAIAGQIITEYELIEVYKNKNEVFELTFKSGETSKLVMTDILLITVPFSILKKITINPPLPNWKKQVINELGYGNNSKMLIGFKKRFWHDLGYSGYFFSNNILQTGWDNSEQQNTEIGGLTIFSAGQMAIDLNSNTDASQANLHIKTLKKMYPGAESQFNGMASRFVWPTFQWSKGSYACYSPGQYTTIGGNEIKPIGKMFFAGEHCSYNFKGFMNGGAETGRIAAEEIVKLLS